MARKGFTIIELVFVLGVFAILMIAGTDFLVTTVRNASRAQIEQDVRQNASKILQDISRQVRKSRCVYYTNPSSATSLLRLADDDTGATCALGNVVEYFQDSLGTVTKAATSSAGVAQSFAALTTSQVAILDCQTEPGVSCRRANCLPGLWATPSGLIVPTQNFVAVRIRAQQRLDLTRSDFCATIQLTDTLTPRLY